MDNEKLKQFLLPIIIVIISFGLLFMLLSKVANNVQSMMGFKNNINMKTQELKLKQEKLETLRKKAAQEAKKDAQSIANDKAFYKPAAQGLDTEAIIVGEFNEILELIRANKIKVRSMKMDPDPDDDAFKIGAPEDYNVARLNLEMIADYPSLNIFLKELYKHEHFLDIESIEIVPYKKNKRILLVNFKIKLYAKK
jgi:hypothetical protein